jgi:hypothetical protein
MLIVVHRLSNGRRRHVDLPATGDKPVL